MPFRTPTLWSWYGVPSLISPPLLPSAASADDPSGGLGVGISQQAPDELGFGPSELRERQAVPRLRHDQVELGIDLDDP